VIGVYGFGILVQRSSPLFQWRWLGCTRLLRWAGGSDWFAVATVFIAELVIFEADARIL